MNHSAGATPQMRRLLGLAEGLQDLLAAQRQDHDRQRDQESYPEPGAQRAPHHARIARAEGLRRKWRDRRHQPHAEGEGHEIDRARERRSGHGGIAEPADEGEVGRHHRDLPKLRRRHRRRELDGLGKLEAEVMAVGRRRGGRAPDPV